MKDNKKIEITPVFLAGGFGTRLWPLSRKSYPKQFSNLIGENSMFQESVLRFSSSEILTFSAPITLTNAEFRFIVGEQIQNVGIDPGHIIIEPESKNTAPAILAASIFSLENNPEAILIVAPSDHVIANKSIFHEALSTGLKEVLKGNIVTLGIKPDRPETGYGYLEPNNLSTNSPSKLKRFIEKPDAKTAQKMFNSGKYYWNAGIFMFRAKDMLEAFKAYSPAFLKPVKNSVANGKPDLGFFRLDPVAWDQCEEKSIDYAIMEHSKNLVVVPFSGGWSDLGDWNAIWQELEPDSNGVVTSSNAHAIDCQNVLLRSDSAGQELVGIDLEDIVAVSMHDAVLISKKSSVQKVKEAVHSLKTSNISQAEVFPKDHRPWGSFESLAKADRFQVKRIIVKPGAALSLQSHNHRSEHWIVVEGTAKVTVNNDVRLLTEGQSVHVPLGAIHRMENPGRVSMVLIEVQTGVYLGEDDIIRFEDIYSRS